MATRVLAIGTPLRSGTKPHSRAQTLRRALSAVAEAARVSVADVVRPGKGSRSGGLCRLVRPLSRAVLLVSPHTAKHGGSEGAVHGGLVAALASGLALEPVDHVFIDAEGQQPLRGAVEAASDGVGPIQHLGGVRVGRVDLFPRASRPRRATAPCCRWAAVGRHSPGSYKVPSSYAFRSCRVALRTLMMRPTTRPSSYSIGSVWTTNRRATPWATPTVCHRAPSA
jgi:hypothetical protein